MNKNRTKLRGVYRSSLIILVCIIVVIIALNAVLIRRTEAARIETEGQMRLSSIASRIDNSMYRSECLLDSVAMQIEQLISIGGDVPERLNEYFSPETVSEINSESDGSCFSAYAAYNGKLYINDFIPGENFVLDERSWYIGAKQRMGAINVTDPYIDASTGEMCYSMSKLLSDGSTVVGLDFNLSGIQNYIEEMNVGNSGTSLIVSGKGMIVGHSVPEFVGEHYSRVDFYNELVNKVFMLYGESFDYRADDGKYNIFSDKTNYEWYLIVSVRDNFLKEGLSFEAICIVAFMVVFAVSIIVFFIRTCNSKIEAEQALALKDEFFKNMSYELKLPLSRIMNHADILKGSGGSSSFTGAEIEDSAKELNNMLDNLISMSAINKFGDSSKNKTDKKSHSNHKGKIALITAILFSASVFAVLFNTHTQFNWGNTKMQKETELYLYQVKEWVNGNKAVLDVISDSIAAQPDFESDYEAAVKYLDDIVSKYDDISVAYLCDPESEHTVIMNNGWEPDENWHVEERQWYIDTIASDKNFNISAPYLDEQTGLYCTTLSKIVYDSKGNFIGVLGIDYYLDKLIGILGESYTDTGYAFLTDIDGNILNHPFDEYQMQPGYSVNAAELCYRDALSTDKPVIISDYDNSGKVCLAMTEEVSGFKVIVMRTVAEIYGSGITSDIIYIIVFTLCIIIVIVIMRRLTLWQEKVNAELKIAAENAINAGKAKNNFLANMSHEIRTPINAVLGMNEMILRESDEKEIIEYAVNIQSAGRTLLSIINEILDFSKIESGKMEIVPVEYDVSSLINDIVNMIKVRAEKKGLEFVADIDETIPAVLYGDDVRLRQVISNILTNAVKYTHKGSVHLRIKVVEKIGDTVKLEVCVKDTGIGIKEDDLKRLFTSFQRFDQEKNRNIEGTGLGIAIVQRLLNMMNSELRVSSVYGAGSSFAFEIEQKVINDEPVGDFEARFRLAAEVIDSKVIKTAPSARVLVVDDNETNLIVARSLLKHTEVITETASGGRQCIRMLKDKKYDLVFLDHMMPEIDGIETLNRIKEEKIAEGTVFVALTANAIHGARQGYIDAGFDDYLSKPFTGEEIEKCLFSHLDDSLIETRDKSEDKVRKTTEKSSMTMPTDNDALFSVDTGLGYTGGDMETYLEILSVYVRMSEDKHSLIQSLFEAKDWKNYVIEVHALKSTSLSIGSKKLSELAKELELAGKAGNYALIEEKNASVLDMYSEVARFAKEYLEANSVQTNAEAEIAEINMTDLTVITLEKAEELVERVKEACGSFDGDEVSAICDEASGYKCGENALKPLFDKVKAAADDFEFESAAEEADLIIENLKIQ